MIQFLLFQMFLCIVNIWITSIAQDVFHNAGNISYYLRFRYPFITVFLHSDNPCFANKLSSTVSFLASLFLF